VSGDLLPTLVGTALVAAAAAFVLLPFARAARSETLISDGEDATTDRFGLYRQVLELEFDHQLGKLSTEDYEQLAGQLLAQAGQALRAERGNLGAIDEEIEREIAAARAALAAARRSSHHAAERVS
jgi:hypothetical protein